jgi:hypothetical protein
MDENLLKFNISYERLKRCIDKIEVLETTKLYAPVAQLDRVSGYEPEGREFESLRAHQILNASLICYCKCWVNTYIFLFPFN